MRYSVTVERFAPLPVPAAAVVAADQAGAQARHSPDFASVCWFGTEYTFSAAQRAIVAVLWNAWEQGTPDVSGRTLLREADSYAEDVRDVFRGHRAWDVMIRRSSKLGGQAGCFRLAQPGN